MSKPPHIVNVRFRVAFTKAELVEAFAQDAPGIANLPGLRWKIWTFNESNREFASVYLFDDAESATHFAVGPIIAALHQETHLSEIRVGVYEVLESLSRVTRAPLA
jgi:hypothetical protein